MINRLRRAWHPDRKLVVRRGPSIGLAAATALLIVSGCGSDAGPAGPEGPEGPQGPPGPGTTPSISSVSPLVLYREHEETVALGGSGTEWTSDVELDFGGGIEVVDMAVPSPTAVVAQLLADSSAALGSRDMAVSGPADTTTYSGAFQVAAPVEVDLTGTVAPGALISGVALQKNPERPFLPAEGASVPVSTYIAETGQTGTAAATTELTVEFSYFLDLRTPAGPTHLVFAGGRDATRSRTEAIQMPAPSTLPSDLGTSTAAQITEDGGSVIHQMDVEAATAVALTSSDAPTLGNRLIAPDSTTEDVFPDGVFYSASAASWFLVVFDRTAPTIPFDYTLTVDTASVTPVVLGNGSVNGTLSGPFASDYYSFDVAAGESFSVVVGDGPTDTCVSGAIEALIMVRDPMGRIVSFVGPGCREAGSGSAPLSGTYSIRVFALPSCSCTFDYSVFAQIN